MSGFRPTPADLSSPLWRALSAHYTERLATLRAKNDATQPVEQTERLRGQIFEIKALLGLADERVPIKD